MTPETEAQIRARVDAATEGPWVVFDMDEAEKRRGEPLNEPGQGWYFVWSEPRLPYYGAVLEPYRENEAAIGSACIDDSEGGAREQADATFIAHARTDVPLLLDEVARLRAALDRVREVIEPSGPRSAMSGSPYSTGQWDAFATVRAALDGEVEDGVFGDPEIHARLTRAAIDGTHTTGDNR